MLEDLDTLMEAEGIDGLVLEGSAFEKPDVYWLTGFCSPDSIICLRSRGEEPVVAAAFNALERVQKESRVKRTFDLSEIYVSLLMQNKWIRDCPEEVYGPFLKAEFDGDVIGVPDHLRVSAYAALKDLGYTVKIVPHLLEKARATKSDKEVKAIKKAGYATTGAIAHAIDMIYDAEVGPNKRLLLDGKPLLVGDIKVAIERYLIGKGAASAEDMIVAVGKKGFDFHYLGRERDPLKAGVPIIIDVFPRLTSERYVGDVTRTVVKGTPPPKVKAMFDAVVESLWAAVDALTDGVGITDVNMACFATLNRHGYEVKLLNPKTEEGMTHGLGHGIGLDVHELPNLYDREGHFEAGHVVAIEPAVYLRSVGGVRVENDFVVTNRKAKLLTRGLEEFVFV
ncbi:MAG: M24 family metallopeptidase [Candidatus Thorarchaeota archaeon]